MAGCSGPEGPRTGAGVAERRRWGTRSVVSCRTLASTEPPVDRTAWQAVTGHRGSHRLTTRCPDVEMGPARADDTAPLPGQPRCSLARRVTLHVSPAAETPEPAGQRGIRRFRPPFQVPRSGLRGGLRRDIATALRPPCGKGVRQGPGPRGTAGPAEAAGLAELGRRPPGHGPHPESVGPAGGDRSLGTRSRRGGQPRERACHVRVRSRQSRSPGGRPRHLATETPCSGSHPGGDPGYFCRMRQWAKERSPIRTRWPGLRPQRRGSRSPPPPWAEQAGGPPSWPQGERLSRAAAGPAQPPLVSFPRENPGGRTSPM